MKAMILAAGFGTRLRPLTATMPKPLLPVGDTPLIVWNLLLLRQYGIHEVMINLHYLGHMIYEALGDGTRWGMQLTYSNEPVILGTGGGLKAAENFFAGEDFLVLNGDTLIELDLGDMLVWHASYRPLATMVLRKDPHVEQWGMVETAEDGRVLTINGRGCDSDKVKVRVKRRMFAGVHVLNPKVLVNCPAGQSCSIIDAYVKELERGSIIMGYDHSGYWSDVGTLERYEQAQHDIEDGCFQLAARMDV